MKKKIGTFSIFHYYLDWKNILIPFFCFIRGYLNFQRVLGDLKIIHSACSHLKYVKGNLISERIFLN